MTSLGFEGLTGPNPDAPAPDAGTLYPSINTNGPTPVEDPPAGTTPIGFEATGGQIYPTITDVNPTPTAAEVAADNTLDNGGTVVEMDDPGLLYPDKINLQEKRENLFFDDVSDGKKRIDYVLVFRDDSDAAKNDAKKAKRIAFQRNLIEEGLELEREGKEDGKSNFVKIHAPWDVLTRLAELKGLKMPIKAYDIEEEELGCYGLYQKLCSPFELSEDYIKPEPDYFTADFNREREKMFIIEDRETFFTNAQRSLMVHELLLRCRYEEAKNKFGIDRLLKQGVYSAAFPLHEGPYHSIHSILAEGPQNDRHLMFEAWANPRRFYNDQPLDLIRKYFGEKIGIYFAWLGFYTTMLIPASLVGLIVFIYGCATLFSNVPSEEICDLARAGNFTMCPLCDKRCSYWRLQSSCTYSRLTYLFDNHATVFFAGFMAVWAMVFLEFWKRKQAEIQYDWDVAGFDFEQHMRPEFEAKCTQTRKNPVTQLNEPYLPLYSKIPRTCTSIFIVVFMICCVLGAVFGVIMYRIIIVAVLYSAPDDLVKENAKIATTATAACINLVLIMLLNRVYQKIALFLTDMEQPRTDTEYEDSFTFKMYLFQFINYYSSIFYIAFFKGRFSGRPGEVDYAFGYRQDECDPAGCLIELCLQLGIVMVGKQALNNFKEIIIPKLKNWCRSKRAIKEETEENLYTRWEQDNDLTDLPPLGLFEEYLEMVIQYGFITIFVAAFPLAPLFALINNIIEIRLDAYKYVTQWKRPIAQRAKDIGIWYGILQGITFIAVLSNAFIIGWTSDFVPKMVYKFTLSPQESLDGYINNSLSYFDVLDFQSQSIPENPKTEKFGNITECRYPDYRYPPSSPDKYEYTRLYWHVFCARLAFVIVFEHLVFFLTWLVSYLIPDIPAHVRLLQLREVHLAKEARYDAAFSTLHGDREKDRESADKIA